MFSAGDVGALAAGMAARMRDAAIGGAAAPLRQGWLLTADDGCRPAGQSRREWRRRFFVLDSAGSLSYHDSKLRPCRSDSKETCILNPYIGTLSYHDSKAEIMPSMLDLAMTLVAAREPASQTLTLARCEWRGRSCARTFTLWLMTAPYDSEGSGALECASSAVHATSSKLRAP